MKHVEIYFAVENIINWVLGENKKKAVRIMCILFLLSILLYPRKEATGDILNAALCGVYAVDLK